MVTRRLWWLLLLVAAVSLTACRAEADVTVSVAEDGSGTVTVALQLDSEAAERLGELSKAFALDDLRSAGWSVTPPKSSRSGVSVVVSKRFGSPAGLSRVMDEVGGFPGWKLRSDDGLWSRQWTLSGSVQVNGGIEALSDDALSDALGGRPLGMTHDELVKRLAEGSVELDLRIDLPGESDDQTRFSFPITLDSVNQTIRVDTSESLNGGWKWLLAGGGFALAAVAWFVVSPAVTGRR